MAPPPNMEGGTMTTERLARIQLTLIDVLLDCMNMKTNPVDMRKKLGDVRDEVDALVADMQKYEEAKSEYLRQRYEGSKSATGWPPLETGEPLDVINPPSGGSSAKRPMKEGLDAPFARPYSEIRKEPEGLLDE